MTSCSTLAVTGKQKSQVFLAQKQEITDKKPKAQESGFKPGLKPNESGEIMVLMYHNIGSAEDSWVRTPENFTRDLNTLYEKGYRPISLKDYVKGDITTPAGYTPVVITFDDGNENNFEYLPDGSISKNCAVGLLLAFHEKHPDFPLEATFYLSGDVPFGQKDLVSRKLNFLIDNGLDIGNHTVYHPNMNYLSKDDIEMEIGAQKHFLENILTQRGYIVDTFAKPFGTRPLDESLIQYLQAGSSSGMNYSNIAILDVGANPAFSPYDTRFNSLSIPRVKVSELYAGDSGLYNFLQYFDEHPEERFVSDGFRNIITVPAAKATFIGTYSGKELDTY